MLMEFAQARAILEQRDYGLHFDLEKKVYWLTRRDEGRFPNDVSRIPETWGRAHSFPMDVDPQSDRSTVFFHPNGTATPFSLDLVSKNGPVFTLRVNPILGRGSVLEKMS